MLPSVGKRRKRYRRCLILALTFSSSFSLSFRLGVCVAYSANHNISTHIKSTRRLINTNIRDLKTFANNTPSVRTVAHTVDNVILDFFNTPLAVYLSSTQQIEYLTAQYTTAKNKVLSDLDSKSNPALSPFSTGRSTKGQTRGYV